MTITEAAACGTPAVATRIAGHADAVVHERTGLLVDDAAQLRGRARPRARRRRVPRVAGGRRARARERASRGARPRAARSRCSPTRPCGAAGREQRVHRRPADAAEPAPSDAAGRARRSATLVPRAGRVRAGAAQRSRARSRPTRSSTSTSIPARLLGARGVDVGSRTSGWARSPTRTSATCSRWARTTGSSTSSASPTGSRNGCGSARSCSSRPLGVLYLLRTFGLRGPGVVVAALAYMFTPYTLDYSARISVLLHAVGRAAVDDRPDAQGVARRRLALSRDLRARRAGHRRRERDRADLRRRRPGAVDRVRVARSTREVDWRRALGVDAAHRRAHARSRRCGGSPGLAMQGTYGLDILKYTETVEAVATHVDARTRSCAGSATGSSTARTGSVRGSKRRPTTRSARS